MTYDFGESIIICKTEIIYVCIYVFVYIMHNLGSL